ncbi:MAG: VWA domain-containing protein, partial [Burkholderiales bacterium]|nr:VWA domain-containing protein [Burkholderiales bacterium]
RRLRRQFEGDEIDLDASIEVLVDRRLGLAPEPRLFRRPGREAPQSSLLVLLDLSESANDPVADGGRPVLALEQEAAMRLAQAVRAPGVRVAVHGFNSNTREHVGYQRLLDFGAPFDAGAAGRVSAARARHSTRIGAALRHAADMLADEPSSRHTVLVVTDGAPSDIDVFDPRYLVEDARAAVQEAKRRGVRVHCVTLDPAGERDARRIFGWQGYRVVTNPAALAAHLRHVQARATGA